MLERLGHFVNRYPKRILAVGLIALVGFAVLGVGAPNKLLGGGFEVPNAESVRAQQLINDNFGGQSNLAFVLEAKNGQIDDPDNRAAGLNFAAQVAMEKNITNVISYWETMAPSLKSEDGQIALILVHVVGSDVVVEDNAKVVIEKFQYASDAFNVYPGGSLGSGTDMNKQVSIDLARAETIAIPLTAVLLLIAFRSAVAALLPLLIGIYGIFGSLAILFALGSVTNVSIYALNLVTAMSLGLGIDYALLIVSRFREELDKNLSIEEAVVRTVQSAGRTVVFSGATVAVAMLALLFFPLFFLKSFAYAGIAVVLLAMVAALFLLPAALSLLGHRVNWLRIGRKRPIASDSPFWTRLTRLVLRRPVLTATPVVLLLLVMASPILHITFGIPDDRALSAAAPSRTAGDLMRERFSSDDLEAASVVITGNATETEIKRYFEHLSSAPGVVRLDAGSGTYVSGARVRDAIQPERFNRPGVHYAEVVSNFDPLSGHAEYLLETLRAYPFPEGTDVLIGGQTAFLIDLKVAIQERLLPAVVFIAITTLVLLFLYTGSVILPIKAVIMNLLTMGAVLGAIVWVFQDGNLSGILDFNPSPINIPMPMLLFCIAFGLSMDYEVFVLSRIKEAHDAGMSTEEALVYGLGHTARIITTAAALLSVTFIAFGLAKVSFLQLFGLGTALAIVLDATLVRGVLVPAFMRLMGSANWWAPKPLRDLYTKIGLRH